MQKNKISTWYFWEMGEEEAGKLYPQKEKFCHENLHLKQEELH